ncbi:unnamed protein product [Ilex paraguariensis]|uniref:non-specific serine/threonine protein kinase n=1 Tax=Ilex paraguariensis TaxID=185542 RepID=A0ABC8RVD9_9AQUA
MKQLGTDMHEGIPKPANKSNLVPRRSPPPPPLAAEPARNVSPPSLSSGVGGGGGPLGAFWNTQHAKDSVVEDNSRLKFDDEVTIHSSSRPDRSRTERLPVSHKNSPPIEENLQARPILRNVHRKSVNRSEDGPSKDFEIKLFQDDSDDGCSEISKGSKSENTPGFQSEAFNAFVTEFGTNKLNPGSSSKKSGKEDLLEAEIERLKEQLKQANMEKAEITSKYDKLSAICRSQRQEIHELKQTLGVRRTPSPNRDASKHQTSPGVQPPTAPPQREKERTVWDLPHGPLEKSSPSPDPKLWQAFAEDPKPQTTLMNNTSKSVRTRNGHQHKQAAEVTSGASSWGFGTDNFMAVPVANSEINIPFTELNNSQRFVEPKSVEKKSTSQPAGWAGF